MRSVIQIHLTIYNHCKVLELIQTWGTAFRNSPKYRIVTNTLNLMQAEGWKFPPVRFVEKLSLLEICN